MHLSQSRIKRKSGEDTRVKRKFGEDTGLELHLGSLRKRDPSQLAEGDTFEGNVILDPDAKIGANCKIGPNVSIGKGCEIGDGVRIRDSVLLHRVVVCPLHHVPPL